MQKENMEWIYCPICGGKARNRIREDTVLMNYPLYYPKFKQETLIEAKHVAFAKAACRYAMEQGRTPIAVEKLPEEVTTTFEESMWSSLVDYVTVSGKDDLRFMLACGVEMQA